MYESTKCGMTVWTPNEKRLGLTRKSQVNVWKQGRQSANEAQQWKYAPSSKHLPNYSVLFHYKGTVLPVWETSLWLWGDVMVILSSWLGFMYWNGPGIDLITATCFLCQVFNYHFSINNLNLHHWTESTLLSIKLCRLFRLKYHALDSCVVMVWYWSILHGFFITLRELPYSHEVSLKYAEGNPQWLNALCREDTCIKKIIIK